MIPHNEHMHARTHTHPHPHPHTERERERERERDVYTRRRDSKSYSHVLNMIGIQECALIRNHQLTCFHCPSIMNTSLVFDLHAHNIKIP